MMSARFTVTELSTFNSQLEKIARVRHLRPPHTRHSMLRAFQPMVDILSVWCKLGGRA